MLPEFLMPQTYRNSLSAAKDIRGSVDPKHIDGGPHVNANGVRSPFTDIGFASTYGAVAQGNGGLLGTAHYVNASTAATYYKVDKYHLHGQYALDDSLEPLWKPVPLKFRMTHDQRVAAHTGYCFNTRVSESIPLDRPVPDYNSRTCRSEVYPPDLPPASVIIVFHNENLSVLLRSLHSVLNRTPPRLLDAIILVNDNSNKTTHPWLFEPLDEYVSRVPKTRVVHLTSRHGLMRARIVGADLAQSRVLVFLDSHIETTPRWIEPLIAAIHANRTTVVVPFIHTIGFDDFSFESGAVSILSFSWSLGQKHLVPSSVDYKPLRSPVMAGGLFAIDKHWFEDLGQYDKEMRLYGGEEMEIGFKVWMCGGQLLALPCSRVGHVFRSGKFWNKQVYTVPAAEIYRNKLRVAEVWMDDYAYIARAVIGRLPDSLPLGSLDEARAVRERLRCRSFQWYLDNVATDVVRPKLGEGSRLGAIRNPATSACLDTLQHTEPDSQLGAYPCHYQGGSQAFLHERNGPLYPMQAGLALCADRKHMLSAKVIMTASCTYAAWIYNNATQQMILGKTAESRSPQCLEVASTPQEQSPYSLVLAACRVGAPQQMFVYLTSD